jgi:sugar transferase EpsL
MALPKNLYAKYKRVFDLTLAVILIVVFFMPAMLIALLVALRLGRPIIYKQKRPGLNGEIFEIRKFRTMTMTTDSAGNLLADEFRLTTFGKWLRSTSLDELPELINVVKGEMSLVGPRPLLVDYLSLYSPEQARRHEVRPGLTGLAQVSGRNTLDWEKRLSLDVWYIDNCTFRLDLKILYLTIFKVIRREGITSEGSVTTSRFSRDKESK